MSWYQELIAHHPASHFTSQRLLCGTTVGSSSNKAFFCFLASATTLEKKSAKVQCGTRMPFAVWQHKGACLSFFGISIFWRAFARQWSYRRQCRCPQRNEEHRFLTARGHTHGDRVQVEPEGADTSGHLASWPFCWQRSGGVRFIEHTFSCQSSEVLAGVQALVSKVFCLTLSCKLVQHVS